MFSTPIFFYTSDSTDGAGGAPPAKIEEPITPTEPSSISLDEFKNEFGLESIDAVKELLRKNKEANIPSEEKQKQENLEKANFLKYAAEQNLMKVEDYNKFESVKAKADADLVFEDFAAQYRADNPESSGETIEVDIKEAFNNQYHLNSESKTLKSRGQKQIGKEAQDLRTPLESTYKSAQEKYSENKKHVETFPKYKEAITATLNKLLTDEVSLFKTKEGEEEVEVKLPLSKEEKESIAKKFDSPNSYHAYVKAGGKPEDFEAYLTTKVNGYILNIKKDELGNKIAETFKGIGVKQGSNIGANNPFALNQQNRTEAKVVSLDESNAKIAEARERAAR